MKSGVVYLTCITNMHVGNGEQNYNLIDNEVEKDCVTEYPTINSSGLKGALREYFNNDPELKKYVTDIFGSDTSEMSRGKVKMFSADMIARPFRTSRGARPYYLVTTSLMLKRYEMLMQEFVDPDFKLPLAEKNKGNTMAEGIKLEQFYQIPQLLSQKIYEVRDQDFKNVSLPVMPRNKLDNGISEHLWFEEVVPHESIFVFFVMANENDEDAYNNFVNNIDQKIVQIGGNASIGYGFCKAVVVNRK